MPRRRKLTREQLASIESAREHARQRRVSLGLPAIADHKLPEVPQRRWVRNEFGDWVPEGGE